MSSNVTRRAETSSKLVISFGKRQKLDEEPSAMSVSEQPGDRRPNFSAVNGGVKTSATIAAKPGDIKKIVIKNFKSEYSGPLATRPIQITPNYHPVHPDWGLARASLPSCPKT